MRDRFIPTDNDHSYYPLLFLALEETKTGDVIEMGTGYGSTKLLHDYCVNNKRWLHSFDEKEEWASKFKHLIFSSKPIQDGHLFITKYGHEVTCLDDWDDVKNIVNDGLIEPTVVFIDHAPGERRKEDIVNFKDINGILVVHDTEPTGAGDYQMRQHFPLFKYVIEVKTNGAWATALSNHYDVTKWEGQTFGNYKVGC